jgi:hypothetical protein
VDGRYERNAGKGRCKGSLHIGVKLMGMYEVNPLFTQ